MSIQIIYIYVYAYNCIHSLQHRSITEYPALVCVTAASRKFLWKTLAVRLKDCRRQPQRQHPVVFVIVSHGR